MAKKKAEQVSVLQTAIEQFKASRDTCAEMVGGFVKDLMMRSKLAPLKFQLPQNIIVVGAGGTGGWFAPKIAKIASDALNKRIVEHQVNIVFVDNDVIETKNLRRQNFVQQDVGKNKAEVIANRYQHSVTNQNVRMGYLAAYLVDEGYPIAKEDADKFVYIENFMANHTKESYLVINLIDNMKSRKAIHKFCYNKGIDVIDVANNDYNGQLNYAAYSKGAGHIGSFFAVYPDAAVDDDMIVLHNCADADAAAVDQLFNANDMAATVLGTFLANAIADGKIMNHHFSFCTGANMSVAATHPFMVHTGVEGAIPTDEQKGVLNVAAGNYDVLMKAI